MEDEETGGRTIPDGVDLTKSQFEMVSVIEDVHKIRIERMNVLELWELCDYRGQFVMIILLRVFDLRMKIFGWRGI